MRTSKRWPRACQYVAWQTPTPWPSARLTRGLAESDAVVERLYDPVDVKRLPDAVDTFAVSTHDVHTRPLAHAPARALATACALTATGMLVIGCGNTGSGSPTASASHPPTGAQLVARPESTHDVSSSTTPVSNSSPVTKARALAFAHAVNLTAADVPETTAPKKRERPEHEHDRCGEVAHRLALAIVKSPQLKRGADLEQESIASTVTVMPSARLAARDISSAQTASGRACYARFLQKRYAGKSKGGVRFDDIHLSTVPVHAAGASGSVGLRIAMMFTPLHTETSVPFYFDLLAFTTGPAEIDLLTSSFTQPEPAATERQLISLLAHRAQAHAHAL